MMIPLHIFNFLLLFIQITQSVIIKHDFNVTWVWTSPDNTVARPVIGINDQWPLPQINATVGDTLVINVLNSLGNQSTSLHFHGLFMNGTSHMDGTSFVSQCAIPPGAKFTYEFTVKQPGTYWYHSHIKTQYPDGLRGLLIVRDPESPYRSQYNEEIVLSVSDWYHNETEKLITRFGYDPPPDTNLMNDMSSPKIRVQPNKTYLVRLVNIGAFVGQWFWIEGHVMRIVEVDGVYTQEAEAKTVYLATGQRYSFLLTTKSETTANYPMVSRIEKKLYSMSEDESELEALGWLVYDDEKSFPDPTETKELDVLDDMTLVPYDKEPLFDHVDQSISMVIDMTMGKGGMLWMFNKMYYEPPTIPSLFSALEAGANATDPELYNHTQPFILEHNKVVEIVMTNKHMLAHPIHLHGHNFQVVERSPDGPTEANPPEFPMRRDTVVINSGGTLRIRFRADNPGIWLFHCHMEWHAHSGLVATIIEAPLQLQLQSSISALRVHPDPQRICAPDQVPDIWDAATSRSWSVVLMGVAIALCVGMIVMGFVFWRYLRRGGAAGTEDQAYTLVPLKDADGDADGDADAGDPVPVRGSGDR